MFYAFCLPGIFSSYINIQPSKSCNNLKLVLNVNTAFFHWTLGHLLGYSERIFCLRGLSSSGLQHQAHTYFQKLQIFVEHSPWWLRSEHPINRQDCISPNASAGTGQHCSAHCLARPFLDSLLGLLYCSSLSTSHSVGRYRGCLQIKWFHCLYLLFPCMQMSKGPCARTYSWRNASIYVALSKSFPLSAYFPAWEILPFWGPL